MDLIKIPFGYLLEYLYQLFNNYGLALILFSLVVKLVLLPASMKSKKSMMKTSRLQPKVKQLELACGEDKQKYQQEVNALYKEEGVSMFGGCLWSLLPLLILFPLYSVIRYPLEYMLHMPEGSAAFEAIKAAYVSLNGDVSKSIYWQLTATRDISTYVSLVADGVKNSAEFLKEIDVSKLDLSALNSLKNINFIFLGVDLSVEPTWKIWTLSTWKEIGGSLIPIVSGGFALVSSLVSQKLNNTVIKDENGEKDEAAAKAASSGKMMLYMAPVMSVWFGYMMPLGLSIYWIAQSLFGVIQEYFLTVHYRKIYDAEDEIKRQKAAERAAEEAEKERIRAAKRAANPDGIMENTSKKKQQLREKQEREAAAKEFEAKKLAEQGIVPEEKTIPGSEPNRPYARGRSYVADRYSRGDKEE